MPAGYIYKELHSDLCGIDDQGNLALNTVNKLGPQIKSGNVPTLVGAGIPSQIGITNAAGGTQYYCDVAFQVQDCFGAAVKDVFNFDVMLSDAATGAGLTATTASGGISAESSDGTVLSAMVASKALRVQTNANGLFGLQIIDSAKTGFYPVASFGRLPAFVGAQLTTASYHA